MISWGGRALCPLEEYDDLTIREEMAWHALEEALADAGWLEESRHWPVPWSTVAGVVPDLALGMHVQPPITIYGWRVTLRARTDDHLGEDASGLVDLTCTLTPA